jgi:hypothetical protein
MITLNQYAIRQKSTGFYIHASATGRGGTYQEPLPIEFDRPPRLFKRPQYAKSALDWWLGGRVSVYCSYDGDETWSVEKRADRIASDMEIVHVILSLP